MGRKEKKQRYFHIPWESKMCIFGVSYSYVTHVDGKLLADKEHFDRVSPGHLLREFPLAVEQVPGLHPRS